MAKQFKNNLHDVETLHNQYFFMRHGFSEGNQKRIVNGDPRFGIAGFDVIPEGERQIIESVRRSPLMKLTQYKPIRIYTSQFRRAVTTAIMAKEVLAIEDPIIATPALNERYFGPGREGKSPSEDYYREVWELDQKNPSHTDGCAESAWSVADRVTRLIAHELEVIHKGIVLLMVGHGDSCGIGQAMFEGKDPSQHPSITSGPFQNAEIREMTHAHG